MLITADYIFAYFDGINRFYVAKERSDLLTAFYAPPNFFDNFQLHEVLEAQNRMTMITVKLEATEARIVETETRLVETEARLREIESRGIIKNIFYSLPSWLQEPLRLIKKFLDHTVTVLMDSLNSVLKNKKALSVDFVART